MTWRDRRVLDLLNIELPIFQAPMAGSDTPELAIAVSQAGGLGALACATRTADQIRQAVQTIRETTQKPFNLNFFCHKPPVDDAAREQAWHEELSAYFAEFGVAPDATAPFAVRAPFDEAMCELIEELKPPVVSFHFGLPEPSFMTRIRAMGARILSSATTVAEAVWLEKQGCDAIIAQGFEAGGHRGMFLSQDAATQVGTLALVPQIVDAVSVPVIAAGGIADGRGVAAAFVLGASAAQVGTAYLLCSEARPAALHKKALGEARDDNTALTNVFTGKPARGLMTRLMVEIGPISSAAPDFPLAGRMFAALRAKAEASGDTTFTNLWAGQAAALCHEMPAAELTQSLAATALHLLQGGAHG